MLVHYIEGNLLGDSPDRTVSIYLPPTYNYGADRYPVIYLLNEWGDTDRAWIDENWVNVPQILDQYFAGETHREMIVVIPSGFTKFGGTFYTNSIATGN